MPQQNPRTPPKSGAFLALALLLGPVLAHDVVEDTKADEGVVPRAYPDLGGIWSICSGSTHGVRKGEVDTAEQCDARTAADLLGSARIVLRCAPGLKDPERHEQLRAVIRFQNNTGKFCSSSAAPLMRAGKLRAGCDRLLRYNGVIGRRPIRGAVSVRRLPDGRYFSEIRGLDNRRAHEHAICVSSLGE